MLNRCEFIGYLGGDPATKYLQNGDAVTDISVAATEKWKDKSGEKKERTEWVRVTFFGKLAEIAGEYLSKGKLVYVAGRMQTDKYTDKDGIERYSTKIIGNEMKMLGGKDDRDSGDQRRQDGDRPSRGRPAPAQRRAPQQQSMDDDFDDDSIPF